MNLDYYEDADVKQFKEMQELIEPAYPMDVRIFDIWRFRPHVNAFKKAINNPGACDLIPFKDQYKLAKFIADKYAGKALSVAIIYYEVAKFAFDRDPHKKAIVPDILFKAPKPLDAQALYGALSDEPELTLIDPSEEPEIDFRPTERRILNNYQKSMNALQQWENGIRSYMSGDQLRACTNQAAKEAPSLYADLGDEPEQVAEETKPVPRFAKSTLDSQLGDLFASAPKAAKPKFDAKQFADKKENGLGDMLKGLFGKNKCKG